MTRGPDAIRVTTLNVCGLPTPLPPLGAVTYRSFRDAGPRHGGLSFRARNAVNTRLQGVLTVELSGLGVVVANTHLTANKDGDWSSTNRYFPFQRAQLELLYASLPQRVLTILTGDFNIASDGPLYPRIVHDGVWRDPFAATDLVTYHPEFPSVHRAADPARRAPDVPLRPRGADRPGRAATPRRDLLMHPMLRRLDELGTHLATRGDALALLGVGSAGVEHDRFDEHSDLDFFVIVEDGAKARYLESIDWLEAPAPIAYSFANDHNGRRAFYADGIFIEYAIFTVAELARIPFTGARVIWQRDDAPVGLADGGRTAAGPPFDTVEFHLNEALTNLYVGLHRELRGERLTAARFIQSYAVDCVIALLRLTSPSGRDRRDPFDLSRRVEQRYPPDVLPLAAMVPGYERNRDAARATLAWLVERFDPDPVITNAVRALLGEHPRGAHGTLGG